MAIPASSEYPPFFAGYVGLVPEIDIVPVLAAQTALVEEVAASVGADRELYAYGPGKWTIRQVMGHLVDAERVFAYRALCFSRGEQQPLPGFNENAYVDHARFNDRRLAEMTGEFALMRQANVAMLGALDDAQWSNAGVSNGKSITVRAIAYVMAGHVRHHVNILAERYGVDLDR
jgi:hypothetical protein